MCDITQIMISIGLIFISLFLAHKACELDKSIKRLKQIEEQYIGMVRNAEKAEIEKKKIRGT